MRYLVFNYHTYYPSGGANDLAFATDDLVQARHKAYELANLEGGCGGHAHVLDTVTLKIVYDGESNEELDRPILLAK